jgi:electron transport complex protein RnfA
VFQKNQGFLKLLITNSIMENLLWIFISALLINNFTLTYFLGICPFLGVSGKLETAFRLGLANIFVMLITSLWAWALNTFVLPYAPYLRLISFIIVIASTVQLVEMTIKKMSPALFKALGIFLPLITTNCAILGLALFTTNKGYGLVEGLIYALGAGGGVTLALLLMAGIREETKLLDIPKAIEGTALSLIIAGILSMAFMGFAGMFSVG